MNNNIDLICANAPELQADEGLDAMPCSASDLLERWEKRIRDTPERAKSGGVDYVGGLLDAYGTCLHELREFLEHNVDAMARRRPDG
jgi:hypothetical protein